MIKSTACSALFKPSIHSTRPPPAPTYHRSTFAIQPGLFTLNDTALPHRLYETNPPRQQTTAIKQGISMAMSPTLQDVNPKSPTGRRGSEDMRAEFPEWRAMGDGGVSPTWEGYLSQLAAEQMIKYDDTLSSDIYQHPETYAVGWQKASPTEKVATNTSFLSTSLPPREGPRSRAKHFVIPQRERNANEQLDPKIELAYQDAFSQLGEQNKAVTEWKISELERHGTALFLRQSEPVNSLAGPANREICHIHSSDCSGHVTLSFADAQEVIAKGWGERHRLSGTDRIHLGYTMVYVPRTVEETEVMIRIFQAGLDFMRTC